MTDPINPGTETPVETPAPTPEKSTRQMSFTELDNGDVRADFGPGLDPVVFTPAALPEALLAAALTEGVIARLRSYTSKLVGDSRTPANLRESIVKGVDNLFAKGIWKIEREPGEPGASISIEAEAAWIFRQKRAAAKGEDYLQSLVDCAKDFGALSDDKKKQLKAVPAYQVAYAAVKARKAAENAAKLAKAASEMGDEGVF
jgi:hypothetical protein